MKEYALIAIRRIIISALCIPLIINEVQLKKIKMLPNAPYVQPRIDHHNDSAFFKPS